VPFIDSSSRVGRSQGASIFWGLVSVFFAAAACFYFWKSHENEITANKFRDEVYTLQDQRDTLTAEKDKLQASMSNSAGQLKSREDFLDEKEAKLAAQESRLDAIAQKPQAPSATTPKKFNDLLHRLSQDDGVDVVTRGSRQVLRIPNASFFAPGEATLKPDGQALLTQIAQSLGNQSDAFELRIESYADTDPEAPAATPPAKTDSKPGDKKDKDKSAKPTPSPDPAAKSPYATGWDLTAARAAAIAHYFHDQGTLPFQNVLVTARGDSQPIVTSGKNRARNSRTEFSLVPVPGAAHATDTAHASSSTTPDASTDPLAPPPDPPASTPSSKDKDKDKANAK